MYVRAGYPKKVLNKTKGIGFVHFDGKDVVRHVLVKRIIEAYDMVEKNQDLSNKK